MRKKCKENSGLIDARGSRTGDPTDIALFSGGLLTTIPPRWQFKPSIQDSPIFGEQCIQINKIELHPLVNLAAGSGERLKGKCDLHSLLGIMRCRRMCRRLATWCGILLSKYTCESKVSNRNARGCNRSSAFRHMNFHSSEGTVVGPQQVNCVEPTHAMVDGPQKLGDTKTPPTT